jgi:hypothetical protein
MKPDAEASHCAAQREDLVLEALEQVQRILAEHYRPGDRRSSQSSSCCS